MGCGLGRAPGVAREADRAALAGEDHQVVVPAVVTPCLRKAVGTEAALQRLAKGLLYIGGRRVVIALAVKLAGAGQLKPDLEMRRYDAVQQVVRSGWRGL